MYSPFDRRFFGLDEDFTVIGGSELGGKALGLASVKRIIEEACPAGSFPGGRVGIPRLAVLGTEVLEQFKAHNDLYEVALADLPDERVGHAFIEAELPPVFVGDLLALIARIHRQLAVRSSSLPDDALQHPLVGMCATKMIANTRVDGRNGRGVILHN